MARDDWQSTNVEAAPLRIEDLERAFEQLVEQSSRYRPAVTIHSPRCPMYVSGGTDLCTCGGILFPV